MQTRQLKIAFLKGLAKGQRTIAELSNETIILCETGEKTGLFTGFTGPAPKHLINADGLVTTAKINEYQATHPSADMLCILWPVGYGNWQTEEESLQHNLSVQKMAAEALLQ